MGEDFRQHEAGRLPGRGGRHIQLVGPDAFVSSGIERFTVAAGAARPTVSARFTDVFQRQKDGQWKIINEHVSMPPTPSGQL